MHDKWHNGSTFITCEQHLGREDTSNQAESVLCRQRPGNLVDDTADRDLKGSL